MFVFFDSLAFRSLFQTKCYPFLELQKIFALTSVKIQVSFFHVDNSENIGGPQNVSYVNNVKQLYHFAKFSID